MRPIAKTTGVKFILVAEHIIGYITILLVTVGIPVGLSVTVTPEVLAEPMYWLVIGGFALFMDLGAWLLLVRPYLLYRKLPEVQAEADEKYLYIHGKKEAKIPLTELEGANFFGIPQNFLVITLGGGYGTFTIETLNHGNFKLRFVDNVKDAPERLVAHCTRMTK